MNEERDDLLDERVLRRSLRLEADEGRPRFDAAAIAALARRSRGPSARTVAVALAAAGLLGVTAGAIWTSIFDVAPTVFDFAMTSIVDLAVALATIVLPLAELAREPALPLSLVAAFGIAILHQLRERRERAHANAS